MIVVDTNLFVGLFIPGDKSGAAESVFAKDPHWAAPFLWRSEFRNVLAMGLRRKMLTFEDACLVMEEAESLMSEDEYDVPSEQILNLANQSRLTAYDCEFVALARQLAVPFVTWDRAVVAAFPETTISPEQFVRT